MHAIKKEIFPVEENSEIAVSEPAHRFSLKSQVFNSLLRLMPLGAKFVLTLYMGRYLSLHDFGMYGYIFATVIILTTALGQRLDFIVTRDIVDMPADIALQKIRDGAYFYLANYVVLALVIFGLIGIHAVDLPAKAMIYILALSVLESFCTVLNTNMNALNQQLLANLVFFIRAGVWVLPVMVLGLMNPAYRTYDAVLIGWAGGATLSLFATLWCWRDMPWREVMQRPFDWNWLVNGVKKSSLLWIGMIGLIGGSFADRYIVEYFLGWDYVAVLTFYASFTNAILTLMQSGIIVFSYPRLIAQHRDGDITGFRKEVWHTIRQMATGATLVTIVFGVGVPLIGHYLGRKVFVAEAWTFWLLLLGTWIRANTEIFFYVLFARHQDRPLWLGNLLFFIPSLVCSIILVPLVGFSGIGYSCILSGLLLLLWRLWHVRDLLQQRQA